MQGTKRKIKDYAKNLYLTVNEEGNKLHTYDAIAKLVQKKYKIAINLVTIQRWCKKEDWDGTFIKLKQAGLEKGKEQLQEKENKLIDEKSQTIADIYKSNKTIQRLSQQTIVSRLLNKPLTDADGKTITADVGTTDLIRLLQHAENTILNLHDKGLNQNPENDTHRLVFKKFKND